MYTSLLDEHSKILDVTATSSLLCSVGCTLVYPFGLRYTSFFLLKKWVRYINFVSKSFSNKVLFNFRLQKTVCRCSQEGQYAFIPHLKLQYCPHLFKQEG